MSIDKAEWHYEGEWPNDLPIEQASVHIGMFLGWIIDNNMQSSDLDEHYEHLLDDFKARRITGSQIVKIMDGSLVESDLNEEVCVFALESYDKYLTEIKSIVDAGESGYETKDTWENLQKIKNYLDATFSEWRKTSEYKLETPGNADLESILSAMSKKTGYSQEDCRATYQNMLDIIADEVAKKSRVTLEGFGTFDAYNVTTPAIALNNGNGSVAEHISQHIRFNAAVPFKKAVDAPVFA